MMFCVVIPLQHRMVLFACLLSDWAIMIRKLLDHNDTTARYRIGSQIKVSQHFDYKSGALPTKICPLLHLLLPA